MTVLGFADASSVPVNNTSEPALSVELAALINVELDATPERLLPTPRVNVPLLVTVTPVAISNLLVAIVRLAVDRIVWFALFVTAGLTLMVTVPVPSIVFPAPVKFTAAVPLWVPLTV